MKRLILTLGVVLIAASAFAQQPATNFPSNARMPVFVIPASAVGGGGTFPAQLFGPQSCTVPAYAFTGATTTGYGMASSTPCVVVGGTQRLGVSSTAVTSTVPYLAPNGAVGAPAYSWSSEPTTGQYFAATNDIRMSVAGADVWRTVGNGINIASGSSLGWGSSGVTSVDVSLSRGAANTLDQKNGTNAQTYRYFGYTSGSRSTFESIASVTTAVTLSGASTSTGNVIPAGATVVDVATSTTTTITGASGYTVGDGSDVDRYGDITGTAVGTNSGSTNYTADPRWWTAAARAIVLTAKTSNFTGGVVQVTVFYRSATGS